jgi:hypothetical protein
MPGYVCTFRTRPLLLPLVLAAVLWAGIAEADIITYSWVVDVEAGAGDIYLNSGDAGTLTLQVSIQRTVDVIPSLSNVVIGYPQVSADLNGDLLGSFSSSIILTRASDYGPWVGPLTVNLVYVARLIEPNLTDTDSVTFHVAGNGGHPVPDPGSTILLLGTGLFALGVWRGWRR